MKVGPAYLIMTILLLSNHAGSEENPKGEDSKNPPPAESKETSPSPPEQQKQPPEKAKEPPQSPGKENKQPPVKKEPPPSPSEEKKQPPAKKEDPPSPSEEKKPPAKEKKEISSKDPKKDTSKKESGDSPPPAKEEKPEKENVNKETASKQKEKEKETSDKEHSKTQPEDGVLGLKEPGNAQVEDNWLLSIVKMVDTKGMVTKLVTQVKFKSLPEDLAGKSEEDIMGYVDILAVERENIQERLLFDMGLKMFVGFVSYEYYNHGMLLSPLKYLADNDVNLSVSIGKQWKEHQERLAKFVCKLMKVRKIGVNSLPKSQLGIPLIKLKRTKDAVVSFPVWRTEEDAELPPEAKQITGDSKSMLLNFWVN